MVTLMLQNYVKMHIKIKNKALKPFGHWRANASANELINNFAELYETDPDTLFIIPRVKNELKGTYVHPDLIPHIACWASPKFAIMVTKIVNKYLIGDMVRQHKDLIKEKDDKIDELTKKMDHTIKQNEKILEKNTEINTRVKKLSKLNREMYNQNEELIDKVDTVCVDRVIPTGYDNDVNQLIITKNNPDPNDYEEDEKFYEYTVFRVMTRNIKSRLACHMTKYPYAERLLNIRATPNANILWKNIVNQLGRGHNRKIIARGCGFRLKNKYTDRALKRDIKRINDEKFDTDDI